jgi:cytochrome c-type biogenesis protein CcmH/NrfG
MFTIHFAIFIMLVIAIIIVSIPFIRNKIVFSRTLFLIIIFKVALVLTFLQFHHHDKALSEWLAYGKLHYELLAKFKELGGVDGAIANTKKHLGQHPEDSQAWIILGKLYLAKQDLPSATAAMAKAQQLQDASGNQT